MDRRLSSFYSMQSGESKHTQPIAVEGQCLPQWSNERVLKAKSSEKRTRVESKTGSHHPLTLYCALSKGRSTVCTTRFQTSSFFWVKRVLWIQAKQKQTGQADLPGPHAFTTLEHTLLWSPKHGSGLCPLTLLPDSWIHTITLLLWSYTWPPSHQSWWATLLHVSVQPKAYLTLAFAALRYKYPFSHGPFTSYVKSWFWNFISML